MAGSTAASPARVLVDVTQSSQQQRNRSHPTHQPPLPATPQKACRASPVACKVQPAHCASPPSSFRHPSAAFSSPTSHGRTGTIRSTDTAAPSNDDFTRWMDAVLPLVHSTPADSDEAAEEAAEEKPSDDDSGSLPYVAINPALLHDSRWAYRDLQLLCQRLGLGGRGDRLHLIHKLRSWNRTHFSSSSPTATASASNFALLCVNSGGDRYAAQLTPLKVKTPRLCDGSPRSAMSGRRAAGVAAGLSGSGRRLSFSVFNGVKLIPPRALTYDDDGQRTETNKDEAQSEQQTSTEQIKQCVSVNSAVSATACVDAHKSECRVDNQMLPCAGETAGVGEQMSKVGNGKTWSAQESMKCEGSGKNQQVCISASPSLRRSARKRLPSRKLRDGQL